MTWFMWNTNHHLRRPQASFRSPEGEEALRPPWSNLRSQAKLAGLVSTHVPDGNSARRGKNDTGESVFPETDPISLFSGLLIYFLLYIRMNAESRGGQQT